MLWSGSHCFIAVLSGKRSRGEVVCASLLPQLPVGAALPVAEICVDGVTRVALVDSDCSRCIIYKPCCASWERKSVSVLTVNGQKQHCEGVGRIRLQVHCSEVVEVDAFVVNFKPLGFECILEVNGIKSLGGVTITPSLGICFGPSPFQGAEGGLTCAAAMEIDEPDFCASYDTDKKAWTAAWKWAGDSEPLALQNSLAEYTVPLNAKAEYEAEVEGWIKNGWLKPNDEKKHGPVKGLIPLMAVVQQNKAKVRPVMDFRELNRHVDAFTARADVCAEKLHEWRRQGTKVAVIDLRRAYLQVSMNLWPCSKP